MKIAITGGTGLVGTKLTNILKAHGHDIIILTRSTNDSKDGIEYVQWLADEATPEIYLEGIDAIVNLAGVSLNEGRWTDERKAAIYNSRQDATNEVLRIIRALEKNRACSSMQVQSVYIPLLNKQNIPSNQQNKRMIS